MTCYTISNLAVNYSLRKNPYLGDYTVPCDKAFAVCELMSGFDFISGWLGIGIGSGGEI